MKNILKLFGVLLITIITNVSFAQNETKKWYFGAQAGLDFVPASPAILTNGVINTLEGCASIADNTGALLFYTDGITIWNKLHLVMANGNGLFGNSSSTQSGIIVKQPGNTNIYFVFTVDAQAAPNGLRYSTVDMNLAAGNGSVTVKNILLQTPSTEKITAVRHCNGVDVWVVSHDWLSNNFRCFLVTAAGVGAAVNTAIGTVHNGSNANTLGYLKCSPNGRKLGLAIHDAPFNSFELYDFNNSTGAVSNPLILGNTFNWAYGVEFSPDGTKLYGTTYGAGYRLFQWDVCAPTNAAILASQLLVATTPVFPFALQLAANGKIYLSRYQTTTCGVINNPNTLGLGCNYVDLGQSTAPRLNQAGFPNFITSYLKVPPPPFTYTVNSAVSCLTASFTPPPTPTINCASAGYSVSSMLWNFGNPASGPSNTSTATNPSHVYTGPGTYTAQLILNYACGADTVKIPVSIVSPSITITTTSATCSSPGSATVVTTSATGPFSYTWTPSAQTTSVATNLTPGIYTVTVLDNVGGCSVTGTANLGSQSLMTGTVTSSNVLCNGATTVSATLAIGSG
ncbi:MAG: PKD domain-containing protein, partial [Bacteroidia bacterium]